MKVCCSCKIELEVSNFGKNKRKKDGLQSRCFDCKRSYDNEYFKSMSSDAKSKKNIKKYSRNKIQYVWVNKLLIERGCIDCGYDKNPAALQFDHVSDKEFNVSVGVTRFSKNRLINEISKCEVRCANCHAIKTSIDFGWYR